MISNFLNQTIPSILGEASLVTFLAIYAAGVLTSISPCVLSMVPVLVGLIGGYSEPSRFRALLLSVFFVLGMASTFALLGVAAVSLGTVFGKVGAGWYYVVAAVSILMGLQLLGVWDFQFPAVKIIPPKVSGYFGAYGTGLLFGIVASPCATPVLVAILALVSSTGKVFFGALLLFCYGLGHGLPLLIVGTFTGAVKKLALVRKWTHNINYFTGTLLILVGLYFLYLTR